MSWHIINKKNDVSVLYSYLDIVTSTKYLFLKIGSEDATSVIMFIMSLFKFFTRVEESNSGLNKQSKRASARIVTYIQFILHSIKEIKFHMNKMFNTIFIFIY